MEPTGGGTGSVAAAATPSQRVALQIAGASFRQWTSIEIIRDLAQISGGFTLDYIDDGRATQALPNVLAVPPFFRIVRAGMPCAITIDGEMVLLGFIDDVKLRWTGRMLTARIEGRDRVGDLVDCAALPEGPAEFKGVDLLHVAQAVCAPYGIKAQKQVDVGAPFARLSANPHETALAFLEKAARQRAVLLVSDGIGGLLLTQGGLSQAPAPLKVPGNVQAAEFNSSWRQRFSDVYVKGQTDAATRRAGLAPAMTSATTPGPMANGSTVTEGSTILMTGHAHDLDITRYRPTVKLTRTQSGMSTAQDQAEWWVRVARGLGDTLTYTALDWRAGKAQANGLGALWRPNAVVTVTDPYADIDKPMLIVGTTYSEGADGQTTRLRVAGLTAFDRTNEAEKRRHRVTGNAVTKPLSSAVVPLTQASTP